MSKVVKQTLTRYKKAILIESGTIAVISGFLFIGGKSAVDFSLGFLSVFLPFCLFVYIAFKPLNLTEKLTALYRGEALKFLLTLVLTAMSFCWWVGDILLFFGGFFTALVLNNLIPFYLQSIEFRIKD